MGRKLRHPSRHLQRLGKVEDVRIYSRLLKRPKKNLKMAVTSVVVELYLLSKATYTKGAANH